MTHCSNCPTRFSPSPRSLSVASRTLNLVEYYWPLIEAGRSTREWDERADVPSFRVPGTDMRIGLPAEIVAAFDESEVARSSNQPIRGAPLVEAYKSVSADLPDVDHEPDPGADDYPGPTTSRARSPGLRSIWSSPTRTGQARHERRRDLSIIHPGMTGAALEILRCGRAA